MANQEINIVIKAIDKFTKGFGSVTKGLDTISKKAEQNSDVFEKMAGYGTAGFAGFGYGLKQVVDRASDLEETSQKFGVVYKDMQKEANDTAKELSDNYGLSGKASKQFLADLGDMTSGFGMSQEASLDYAKKVTELGVDLASFANVAGGSEEAVDRLNKGFLGEHENLKALGIVINETILKKQLLADGTANLTGMELEQAKINARMTIAVRQSQNAIGDFERSKSSLANQTRILHSNIDDLVTNLGNAFLPVITELTSSLVPLVENFASWASENEELVRIIGIATASVTGIIAVLGTLGLVVPTIVTGFTTLTTVTVALGRALMFLYANPIGLVILGITALVTAGVLLYQNWDTVKVKAEELGGKFMEIYEKYKILFVIFAPLIALGVELYKNWDVIKEKATEVGGAVVEKWQETKKLLGFVWEGMKLGATAAFDGIKEAVIEKFKSMIEFVMDAYKKVKLVWDSMVVIKNKVADTVSNAVSSVGDTISGSKAHGGPVRAGKTYYVGERGPELFTPSVSGNITSNEKLGSSQTFNVTVTGNSISGSADEDRLAQKIIDKLRHDMKMSKFGIS